MRSEDGNLNRVLPSNWSHFFDSEDMQKLKPNEIILLQIWKLYKRYKRDLRDRRKRYPDGWVSQFFRQVNKPVGEITIITSNLFLPDPAVNPRDEVDDANGKLTDINKENYF